MSLHSNSDTTLGRVENPSQYTLKRRPWRLRSTSFSAILEHPYSRGDGSAESPFIIEWLPQDHENPQTFSMVYKVCVERQERKVWREGGDNAVVSAGSRRPRTLPSKIMREFRRPTPAARDTDRRARADHRHLTVHSGASRCWSPPPRWPSPWLPVPSVEQPSRSSRSLGSPERWGLARPPSRACSPR